MGRKPTQPEEIDQILKSMTDIDLEIFMPIPIVSPETSPTVRFVESATEADIRYRAHIRNSALAIPQYRSVGWRDSNK